MVASLLLFAMRIGSTRSFSRERGRKIIENFEEIPKLMENYLSNQGPIDEAVELVKGCQERDVSWAEVFLLLLLVKVH
jgi:hypothetical protein